MADIQNLQARYSIQKEMGNSLQFLTLSNLKFQESNEEFGKGNKVRALRLLLESINASVKNIGVLKDFEGGDLRKGRIVKSKEFLESRAISYLSRVLSSNPSHDPSDIRAKVKAEIWGQKLSGVRSILNKRKLEELAQSAELYFLVRSPEASIDWRNYRLLDELKLKKFRGRYIANRIKQLKGNISDMSKDRAKKLSSLLGKLISLREELGEDSYELRKDQMFYHAHSSQHESGLRLRMRALDDFIRRKSPDAMSAKKDRAILGSDLLIASLDSATPPDKKLAILNEVVLRLRSIKHHKSWRYKVLIDWLGFYLSIKGMPVGELIRSGPHLRKLRFAADYEDRDEAWLSANMPEVFVARASAKSSKLFIECVKRGDFAPTGSVELDSSLKLYLASWIDTPTTLRLLKKFVADSVQSVEISSPLTAVPTSPEEIDETITRHLQSIKKGESSTVELKASWAYCLTKCQRDKQLADKVVETVAAFLNSEGGVIYIGVSDGGDILGLESSDFKLLKVRSGQQPGDRLILDVGDLLKTHMDPQHFPLVKCSCHSLESKTFMSISVSRSSSPAFFDDKFIIRVNNGNQKLGSKDQHSYIANRSSGITKN